VTFRRGAEFYAPCASRTLIKGQGRAIAGVPNCRASHDDASTHMSARALNALARWREQFTQEFTARKLAVLRQLARTTLRTADQVRRLHEILCFMRAYPDDAGVLRQVEQMLSDFARRRDLRANRQALAHSGIAGTLMGYPFFYPTAHWLSRRWPDALRLDRSDTVAEESVAKSLPALLSMLENQALRDSHLPGYPALDAVRGQRTDASFLLDCVAAMPGDSFTREAFYDLINPSCELLPGADTPTRTTAVYSGAPRAWQTGPLRRQRPDLRREIAKPPRGIRRVASREAPGLVTLAREAMITRSRDLDAFAYGNEADVWLCDDGDGLAFALVGIQPARRAALPAIYGGLTLRNGVPIGYYQADFLGRSVAVSFNAFETFRDSESGFTFGRLLATLHAFSGVTSFNIEPYQLGRDNDEGISSGAWWFYFKLGFRPRARAAVQLAAVESRRQGARPGYRSTPGTLRQLAAHHLFLDLDPKRPAPLLLPSRIGLRAAAYLATLAPDSRSTATAQADTAARVACGIDSLSGFTRDERLAWIRLAPIFAMLPTRAWSTPAREALPLLARAKGARTERNYARLSAAHRPLEIALARWSALPALRRS